MRRIAIFIFAVSVWAAGHAHAGQDGPDAAKVMTLERMNDLIEAIGDEVSRNSNSQWRFLIENIPVFVVADARADRMRVLVGISKIENMPKELYLRLMQANFDTTLDARYAVARGVVWSAFLHPLKSLTDRFFLSGVGQTVNLARTYGKTFTSGGVTFQGGDSAGIIERELIEKLLEKGLAI
jgi:hypothetical protein